MTEFPPYSDAEILLLLNGRVMKLADAYEQ